MLRTFALTFVFCFYVVGCSSINTKKYDRIYVVAKELNEELIQVVKEAQVVTRESLITELTNDPDKKVSQYMLKNVDGKFLIKAKPVYLDLTARLDDLLIITSSFEDYLKLLSRVASGDIHQEEELVALAKAANSNFSKVAKNVGGEDQSKDISFFSVAATSMLKSYIKTKSSKFLDRLVSKSQTEVDEYVFACQSMIQQARELMLSSYNERSLWVSKGWIKGNRQQYSRALIDLNDQLLGTLPKFEKLSGLYEQIPGLHKELIRRGETSKFKEIIYALDKSLKDFGKMRKQVMDKE